MASVGLRPAWQGTAQNRAGYRPPRPLPRQMRPVEQRLHDPNAGVQNQAMQQFRAQQDMRQNSFAASSAQGAYALPRNQFAEAGMQAMETTGAPALARGVRRVQAGEPGEAIPEFLAGGFNALGMATLPFGGGRAPQRVPRVQPGEWQPAYRGMMQPFDGEFRTNPEGWYGDTLSVSRSPEDASFYARRDTGSTFGEGANVMPLEVRGPFVPQSTQEEIVRRQMQHINPGRRTWLEQHTRPIYERVNNELRSRGYAGVETDIDNEIALFRDENGGFSNVRSRFDAPQTEPTSSLPNAPPRLPGRATDGSILPVRNPEPIRQSLVGGSDDLAEAARMRPDAGGAREGFDTGRVVYRGLGRQYDPANGGYYQSFTSSLDDAREYGPNVIAAHIRPGRNLAIDGGGNNFNALSVEQLPADVRARLHPSVGASATTDQIAHAAREAGYDSVTVRNVHDNRWGERPARGAETRTIDFVFDTRNISPLDNVPSQPSAAASAERVRLNDADRALLAELEDFPSGAQPDGGDAERLLGVAGVYRRRRLRPHE